VLSPTNLSVDSNPIPISSPFKGIKLTTIPYVGEAMTKGYEEC